MNEKYIFLDRDGVINKDPAGWTEYGYVTRREDYHFLPGVLEAMRKIKEAGYKTVIISNQQGVGKGYFTEEALRDVTDKLKKTVEASGGDIAGVYYCIHKKEEYCDCRKPKKGLFMKAREELDIKSFEGQFYVGDTARDIEAGKNAGLNTILVLSGKSSRRDVEGWDIKPDHICKDLAEAVDLIINSASSRVNERSE